MLKVKNDVGALYCFGKLFSVLFLFIHSEESSGTLVQVSFLP